MRAWAFGLGLASALGMLAVVGEAGAQPRGQRAPADGPCSSITAPTARLECEKRLGTGRAATRRECSQVSPCVDSRGRRYYLTDSGRKRYLDRR